MDQVELSPAGELCASIARLRKTIPVLAPVLGDLERYVASLERRMRALEARMGLCQ
jgi:hypothetical protein